MMEVMAVIRKFRVIGLCYALAPITCKDTDSELPIHIFVQEICLSFCSL